LPEADQTELLVEIASIAERSGLRRKALFYGYLAIGKLKHLNPGKAITMCRKMLSAKETDNSLQLGIPETPMFLHDMSESQSPASAVKQHLGLNFKAGKRKRGAWPFP
jgi:hypothetical protein